MVTTINLVDIHHHAYLENSFFFPCDENLKVYSLSNVQIYNTILLTIVPMLYISSSGLIYCIAGMPHLFNPFIHWQTLRGLRLFLILDFMLVANCHRDSFLWGHWMFVIVFTKSRRMEKLRAVSVYSASGSLFPPNTPIRHLWIKTNHSLFAIPFLGPFHLFLSLPDLKLDTGPDPSWSFLSDPYPPCHLPW